MPIKDFLQPIIQMLVGILPFIGNAGLGVTERGVTIPSADVKKLCTGMSTEEVETAINLSRRMADAISDFVVYVASRGKIKPD